MDKQLDLNNYTIWYDDTLHKFWFETVFFYVIILVLVGLIAAFFIFFKKSRVKPYWQVEIDNLNGLEKALSSGISDKDFYTAIIDIARRYVKFKFNIDLSSKTEHEIVVELEDKNQLKIIFLNAIRAKYSQIAEPVQDKLGIISTLREFILKNM